MKRFASTSLAVIIFLSMLIATERTAYGYVDPGSGILALQSFASVVAASAYFLRRRIRSLFARNEPVPVVVETRKSAKAA